MPCPFPGMDPFLELPPFWSDFTPKLLTSVSNILLLQLMPKYEVRIEEYVLLQHDELASHRLRPDVVVSSRPSESGGLAIAELPNSMAQSETSHEAFYPDFDPSTQRRIVLTHRASGKIVTVIEVLSPVNKSNNADGIGAYEQKREELLTTDCHLIELDLLRGGQRLPMRGKVPSGDYYAYIGRSDRRPRCQVIGWRWQSPLPKIPVPLLPEDGESTLDLAQAFKSAYEPAFYDRRLPYHEALSPAMTEQELALIRSLTSA